MIAETTPAWAEVFTDDGSTVLGRVNLTETLQVGMCYIAILSVPDGTVIEVLSETPWPAEWSGKRVAILLLHDAGESDGG